MSYAKEIRWLAQHFKPDQCFKLGSLWYGVIQQADETYAILRVDLETCDFAPDCGEWINWPESRYDSESGCFYAILLNHQERGVES